MKILKNSPELFGITWLVIGIFYLINGLDYSERIMGFILFWIGIFFYEFLIRSEK